MLPLSAKPGTAGRQRFLRYFFDRSANWTGRLVELRWAPWRGWRGQCADLTGLEEAEYQVLFNAEGLPKFWVAVRVADAGVGAVPARTHQRTRCPNPPLQARQAGQGGYGKLRWRSALCFSKANEPILLRVTRTWPPWPVCRAASERGTAAPIPRSILRPLDPSTSSGQVKRARNSGLALSCQRPLPLRSDDPTPPERTLNISMGRLTHHSRRRCHSARIRALFKKHSKKCFCYLFRFINDLIFNKKLT